MISPVVVPAEATHTHHHKENTTTMIRHSSLQHRTAAPLLMYGSIRACRACNVRAGKSPLTALCGVVLPRESGEWSVSVDQAMTQFALSIMKKKGREEKAWLHTLSGVCTAFAAFYLLSQRGSGTRTHGLQWQLAVLCVTVCENLTNLEEEPQHCLLHSSCLAPSLVPFQFLPSHPSPYRQATTIRLHFHVCLFLFLMMKGSLSTSLSLSLCFYVHTQTFLNDIPFGWF